MRIIWRFCVFKLFFNAVMVKLPKNNCILIGGQLEKTNNKNTNFRTRCDCAHNRLFVV